MELSHFPSLDSNYDIWLEHSSKKIGYKLAKDEGGNPQLTESVAPFTAAQIFQGEYSYESSNANVAVPISFESWAGGCGFQAISGIDPLARTHYSQSSYIDASWPTGLCLSPLKQTGGSTTQAPIKFVYSSFGVHVMTTRYVMEWTGAAWTTRLDNTNKTNTDLIEYKNSRGTYLVLTQSDDNYYISTDGITFSQPASGALYPTYRSSSSNGGMIAGALVIDKPSGAAVDDVLFAAISIYSNTVTTPSGWTLIESRTSTTWHTYYYYKRVTNTEPTAYVFAQTGTVEMAGTIVCYQGCATTGTPYESAAYSVANSGTSWATSNSQVCTGYDRTILTLIAGGETSSSTTTSWTTAAGYTERVDVSYTGTTPAAATVAVFDKTNQDPAAVATATFTSVRMLSADGLATQYLLKPEEGSSSLNNGMRLAVRGSADGEPLLWCVDSNGGIRNTPDPTHPGLWSSADTIQFSQPVTISGLEVVDNVFYLYHSRGIDSYDGTTVSTVWDNRSLTLESDAARPYTWVDQKTYFTVGGGLYQYDPYQSLVQKIWPRAGQDQVAARTGTVTAITGNSSNLFFAIKEPTNSAYIIMKCDPYVVRELNGQEYMPVFDIISHSTNATNAMITLPGASDTFNSTNPQLLTGYGTSGDYYILSRNNTVPHNDSNYRFDTTSSAVLYGTKVDVATKLFPKFLNKKFAVSDDVDATYAMTVSAYLDTTDSGVINEDLTINSVGVTSGNVTTDREFTTMRMDVAMRTVSNTVSPRLNGVVYHLSLNPQRMRQWDITIEIAEDLERIGGGDSSYGAQYLRDHLFNGLTERVTYYDRSGTSYVTRILDVKGVHIGRNKIVYNVSLVQLL